VNIANNLKFDLFPYKFSFFLFLEAPKEMFH